MGNALRHFVRRLARTPYAIGLLAIGMAVGASVLSSTAQDDRDQLLLEMDRLINQMQGLRERFFGLMPGQPTVPHSVLVRGFIAANAGGTSELGANSPPLEEIYLPNIEVVLRDPTTNTDSPLVRTDCHVAGLAGSAALTADTLWSVEVVITPPPVRAT